MKKIVFLIFALVISVFVHAQVSKTVNNTAGWLSKALTKTELNTVTNLTIKGTIDARDFKTMRDLMPKLAVIDIETTRIVAYEGDEGTAGSYEEDYPSDQIPEDAFCKSFGQLDTILISVKLPNTITSIGDRAFYRSGRLSSVSIPNTLVSIGESVFMDCSRLRSIDLPETVEEIGDWAFLGSGLESIVIPASVKKFGENEFANCASLKSFIIKAPLTSLPKHTFYNCFRLKEVFIPSTITSIGNNAFDGCSELTSVYIPSSVTSIGYNAFNFCLKLRFVSIPSSVKSIGPYAFSSCDLTNVISESPVPINLASSEGVFRGLNSLHSCTLFVPQGSISAYKAANQWKDFEYVEEMKSLNVSYTFDKLPSDASNNTINLITNSSWSMSISQPWITASTTSGTGNSQITITATANTTPTDRTAQIIFWASDCMPKMVLITQSAIQKSLTVSENSLTIGASAGSTASVDIKSNLTWTAASNESWLTVTPATSTGDATLTVTASKNTAISTRKATVTLTASGVPSQTITVTQLAGEAVLSASQDSISIGKEAGSVSTVDILSNTSWTVASNEPWLTVSPAASTGNATLTFTASENTTIKAREATVTLSATGVSSKTITVLQLAGNAVLSVSSDRIFIGKEAGSISTVDISSNTSWVATCGESWLTVAPNTTTTGNATLTFTALENTTITARSTNVTLSATGLSSKTITVTQAAGDTVLLVSSNNVSVGNEAGSISTINVSSNTAWNASCNESWLTIDPITLVDGNATLTFTVSENETINTRTAIVTVSASGEILQSILVTQDAGSAVLIVSKNEITIGDSTGSMALLEITSNTSWTVYSDQAWLTANLSGGIENDTLILTAESNLTGAERTAVVTVSAEGVTSQTIKVVQSGRVGIDVLKINGLAIFPNPVKNGFQINGLDNKAEIDVYDLSGKLLLRRNVVGNEFVVVNSLTSGVYVARITTSDGSVEKKFVKE